MSEISEDFELDSLYIGVCENQIGDKSDCDAFVSKVGGKAVSPSQKIVDVPKCGVCKAKLYLVSQIYAPIGDLERFLYLFACNDAGCKNQAGSWIGLRYQCDRVKYEKVEAKKEEWKDETKDEEIDDLLALRDVKIEVKKKKKEEIAKIDFQFPCFPLYLFEDDYDSDDETLKPSFHEKALLKEYESHKGEEEPDEDEDEYERASQDIVFDHFQKVISRDPDQVVRTCFNMKILQTTFQDKYIPKNTIIKGKTVGSVDIPKCSCGAHRVPELQILPQFVYFMQVEKYTHAKNDGLDFGTAILFTCSAKCGKNDFSHEYVLVQPPIE